MSNVQNFFDKSAKTGHWSSLYDKNKPASYPFIIRLQKSIKLLNTNITNKQVCDLGCGTGSLIPFVLSSEAFYTGIDFSDEMLSRIKNEYKKEVDNKKVELFKIDLVNDDLKRKYDVLVGLGFVEYFENPDQMLNKCEKFLEEKGLLLLSFPNRLSLDFTMIRLLTFVRIFLKKIFKIGKENPKRKMWSKKEAKNFLSQKFEIIKIENYYVNILAYPLTVLFPKLSFFQKHQNIDY